MVDDCWLERSRNVNCLLFVWMATIRRERSSTICLTRSRCVCSTVFFSLLLLLFPVSFRLPLSDAVEYATRIHLFLYIVYIGSSAGSVGRTRLTLSRSWRPAAAASFLFLAVRYCRFGRAFSLLILSHTFLFFNFLPLGDVDWPLQHLAIFDCISPIDGRVIRATSSKRFDHR